MNVPAIAKKTYDELRVKPEFAGIVDFVLSELDKIPDDIEKARFIHKLVDELNEKVFEHPLVKTYSPCKAGCTACCHTQVSVTRNEALLLIERVNEGVTVDSDLLLKQMKAGDNDTEFYRLSYEDRKCIFLGDNGLCSVYEDRPSVCRTNAVLGNSSQCDTSAELKPTVLVKTPHADMVIYAAYVHAKDNGALPHLLGKLLKL